METTLMSLKEKGVREDFWGAMVGRAILDVDGDGETGRGRRFFARSARVTATTAKRGRTRRILLDLRNGFRCIGVGNCSG